MSVLAHPSLYPATFPQTTLAEPLWPALTAPGHEHTSPHLLSPSIIIFCQIGYHLFHRRQSDNLLNFFFPTPFRASVPSTMCTNPDLLLPLCAIFSNNQLALSQLFLSRLIYDEKMPTFAAEAALNGLAWTNLNDTMRLPRPFRPFLDLFQWRPCLNLNDTMIQWPALEPFCAPFPFKIPFFTTSTHPPTSTHRFLKG